MQIQITDDALDLARRRGNFIALDFITPVGWGKPAEVSVDTNTKGKNLDPYRRVRQDDVEFLVPRNLLNWAADITVDTKRTLLGTRFVVEAGHAHGPGWRHA